MIRYRRWRMGRWRGPREAGPLGPRKQASTEAVALSRRMKRICGGNEVIEPIHLLGKDCAPRPCGQYELASFGELARIKRCGPYCDLRLTSSAAIDMVSAL